MKQLPNNSIDLIYCDILYNTGKKFKDYDDNLGSPLQAIDWYRPRLIQMKMILKETGTIYLQCDYRLSHYLKIEMDNIFGYENFRNEIVWCYNGGGTTKKQWNKKHDVILMYTESDNYTFNTQYQPYNENSAKRLLNKHRGEDKSDRLELGTPMVDWWTDIKCIVNPANSEYVDYNTQKPKLLLERIIKASSNKGDLVADFFCGSGTTCVVAKELERNYLGCDIGEKAVKVAEDRIKMA
jgi:site-specific DNA-methyltransferase (adenine-specific)